VIDFDEFCVMEIRMNRIRPRPDLIDYRDYLDTKMISKLEHLALLHDPSGKGLIGKPQLYAILEILGCTRAQEDVDEVFSEADIQGEGELEFPAFCAVCAVLLRRRKRTNYREFLTTEQVMAWSHLFRMVDEHNLGSIQFKDLERLLKSVGLTLKRNQLRSLFNEFDADKSGDIDFEEFCVMILRLRGMKKYRTINTETCSCWELWKKEHFTIAELKNSGFGLADFKEAGIPVGLVYKEGHATALQLRHAGFTPAELRRGGVGVIELRSCGFSLADLRNAGFSLTSVRTANCNLRGSLAAGNLTPLPQQRPNSTPVLSCMARSRNASKGFPQFEAGIPVDLGYIPPRPMTAMIRDHTDWSPSGIAHATLSVRPVTS
jgi:Ca2+-binding EF-hand superfamily protein